MGVCRGLLDLGFTIYHCGLSREPDILGSSHPRFHRLTHLSFFDSVRVALDTSLSIGTDSGSMWAMGAYSHPAIHLMTSYLNGHRTNYGALTPVNSNGTSLFAPGGANNIDPQSVIESAKLHLT